MKKMEIAKQEIAKREAQLKEAQALIAERDAKIKSLLKNIDELSADLSISEAVKGKMGGTLSNAEKTAADYKEQSRLRFEQEMSKLRLFCERWRSFAANSLSELAPEQIQKKEAVTNKLKEVLDAYERSMGIHSETAAANAMLAPDTMKPVKKLYKHLKKFGEPAQAKNNSQMPYRQQMQAQVQQEQDEAEGGEISQAEILNVKESLADLCKDLGLME